MVLEATDLKVWFPIKRGLMRKVVGHIKAVDGVSIDIRKGETLGVVGKSGSGKTTLGLAILRLISSQGPIVFMGHSLQGLRFKEMRPFRRDMQIVFQDPYGSLSPRLSVADIIKEGLQVHSPDVPERERDARVVRALSDVGSRSGHALSLPARVFRRAAAAHRGGARASCWSRPSSCSTSRPARSTC